MFFASFARFVLKRRKMYSTPVDVAHSLPVLSTEECSMHATNTGSGVLFISDTNTPWSNSMHTMTSATMTDTKRFRYGKSAKWTSALLVGATYLRNHSSTWPHSWRVLCSPISSWRVLCSPISSWRVLCSPISSWRVLCSPISSFTEIRWPRTSLRIS